MNRTVFHLYITLSILILSANIVNGQNAKTLSDDDLLADLSVTIIIESLSDNVLFHTDDSTIFINLYRDCKTRQKAFRDTILFIDTSKTFIRTSFENIPYGEYCVIFKYKRLGIVTVPIKFQLSSDSTYTERLSPITCYDVVVDADPEQYSLYGGYLKSHKHKKPRKYSFVGESDVMNGMMTFTIVGRKPWKIKLGLQNEDEDQFTEFDSTFSIGAFLKDSLHVKTDATDTAAFEWIKVKKVKSQQGCEP